MLSRWLARTRKAKPIEPDVDYNPNNLLIKMLASIPTGVGLPISRENKYKKFPFSGNPGKVAKRRAARG